MHPRNLLAAAIAAAFLGFAPAQATNISVTVENLSATGGLSLSPLFVAFHDGSFDIFDSGAMAAPGVEPLAELGNPGGLASRLSTTDPTAMWGTIPAVGMSGLPQIEPGETGSMTFNVDPMMNQYFSFGSMVVPSNDAFTANDNPMAYRIFGSGGAFLGNKTILLTGLDVWDAGTEANALLGSAFIVGQNATLGTPTSDPVMLHPGFGIFDGQMMPNGQTFDAAAADVGAGNGFQLARITIKEVPEPGTWLLLLSALGLAAFLLRRRSAGAAAA